MNSQICSNAKQLIPVLTISPEMILKTKRSSKEPTINAVYVTLTQKSKTFTNALVELICVIFASSTGGLETFKCSSLKRNLFVRDNTPL